jgi:hypothetical protein
MNRLTKPETFIDNGLLNMLRMYDTVHANELLVD